MVNCELITDAGDEETTRYSRKTFTVEWPDGQKAICRKRPGLDRFLEKASRKNDIHVFTAGTKEYADRVLDKIDPTGTIFKTRFYRDSCTEGDDGYVKDLRTIIPAEDLRRAILIDDNPVSFLEQPSNAILVKGFTGDPRDRVLDAVENTLDQLQSVWDVRPSLHRKFHLRQRFHNYIFNHKRKKEQCE